MTDLPVHEQSTLNDTTRWNIIKRKASETRISQAFFLFRSHAIEPILIKGIAADLYYPRSELRDSVDMDIAVASKDFEAASSINASADAQGLAIDLHCELRHLDTLPWDELVERSQTVTFESGTIRVLSPEDHLRVLCTHWLTDGGANKSRLWDIYYLIKNRPADFEWERFLSVVEPKRRRWLTCTIGLAERFLGLDLSGTPVHKVSDELPAWLIKTVEAEWADNVPLRGLYTSIDDPQMFLKQLKKRLPPNPISSTVLMNGSFDAKTRIFYQIGTSLQRIGPAVVNLSKSLLRRSK